MRAIVALLLSACTLGSPPPDGCEYQPGQYYTRWERIDGDCLSVEEGTHDPDGTRCSGEREWSADGCAETFRLTCPSGVGHYELVGEAHWSSDGRTAEGVAGFTAWIGDRFICEGTYRTEMHKL